MLNNKSRENRSQPYSYWIDQNRKVVRAFIGDRVGCPDISPFTHSSETDHQFLSEARAIRHRELERNLPIDGLSPDQARQLILTGYRLTMGNYMMHFLRQADTARNNEQKVSDEELTTALRESQSRLQLEGLNFGPSPKVDIFLGPSFDSRTPEQRLTDDVVCTYQAKPHIAVLHAAQILAELSEGRLAISPVERTLVPIMDYRI